MKGNGKNLTSCLVKEETIPMLGDCKKCNPRDPKQRCNFYIPWEKKRKKERNEGNGNYNPNLSNNNPNNKSLAYHKNGK